MTRHAFMIMAHDNVGVLEKLIRSLDHPDNDIYLHVDRKSRGIDPLRLTRVTTASRVRLTPRMDVRWGDYSQIACELLLLEEASRTPHRYYHLLSGSDLPLVGPDTLHRFFAERDGTEFVHFVTDSSLPFTARIAQYHAFTRHRRITSRPDVWDAIGRVDDRLVGLQRRFGIDRTSDLAETPKYGSNWFSITEGLARYVLDRRHWIRRRFARSLCGDEVFLQTLVYDSPFRSRLNTVGEGDDYLASARKVDWRRGGPYVWRMEDVDELAAAPEQGYLFARKFRDDVDPAVVDTLLAMAG